MKFQGQLKRLYEKNIVMLLLLVNNFEKSLADGSRTIEIKGIFTHSITFTCHLTFLDGYSSIEDMATR